jgi:hypothetical protein
MNEPDSYSRRYNGNVHRDKTPSYGANNNLSVKLTSRDIVIGKDDLRIRTK